MEKHSHYAQKMLTSCSWTAIVKLFSHFSRKTKMFLSQCELFAVLLHSAYDQRWHGNIITMPLPILFLSVCMTNDDNY